MKIEVVCRICKKHFILEVAPDDFNDWRYKKKKIQSAMPYLSADQRELLISRTCGRCYDNLFRSIENYE